MRRLMVPFIILLLMVPLIPAWGRVPTTISNVTIDGDIQFTAPNYTRQAASADIEVREAAPLLRGFIQWNTVSIPNTAIIEKVSIRFRSYTLASYAGDVDFYKMTSQPSAQPDNNAGNQVIYDDAHDGTLYATTGTAGVAPDTWYTYELVGAAADLQALLASDWFAVGLYSTPNNNKIYSADTAYDPEIIVEWGLPTDYAFTFSGSYYENGTKADAVDAIAHLSAGTEDFEVDTETTQYYPDIPIMFSYTFGTTVRRLYTVGASENFTVFQPDGDYAVYSFEIRDYPGILGQQNSYLEALRAVNGTEILVERNIIWNTLTTTPLVLVQNQVYFLRIRLPSGAYHNVGYFVPGDTAPPTIAITGADFNSQYQPVSRYISIEATRPNATHIRLTYVDTLAPYNTLNVSWSVSYRNGTILHQNDTVAESVVFNWYGATNTTTYLVTCNVTHQYYGVLHYSKILDGIVDYTLPPDFSVLGITTQLLSAGIILFVGGTVSRKGASVGVFAMSIVAYGLNTWGWIAIPGWLITMGFALGVGIKLRGG